MGGEAIAGLVGIRAEDMEQVDALKRARLEWPHGLPFIRPSVKAPVLVPRGDGLDYVPARFGFTSRFASMNARDDKLLSSPLWRRYFGKSHAIVALSYFVEWVVEEGRKQPYLLQRRDGRLMMCPALFGHHMDEKTEQAFALCTRAPNAFVEHFHDRMICDCTPALVERWLHPAEHAPEELLACLRAPDDEEMAAVPASPDIVKRKAGDWSPVPTVGHALTWADVQRRAAQGPAKTSQTRL